MTDDANLLCQYAGTRSESAFEELVRRHVDLVYSAALRQTLGDHHRAQEVTQMVFIDLARKAAALIRHPILPAWLHRSTHLAALSLHRKDFRRHKYEQAAGIEAASMAPDGDAVAWEVVGPVLDEAINGLGERDRQAILLRYFADQPFNEVGRRLSLSENAARMRVERALDKLRDRLASRGITSPCAAIAAALSCHAVMAAPAGMAVSAASAAAAAAGGATTAWIAFMTTSKLPLSLAAALLVGTTALVGVQDVAARRAAAELADLSGQDKAIAGLEAQNRNMAADTAQAQDFLAGDADLPALRQRVHDLEAKAAAEKAPLRANSNPVRKLDAGAYVYDISKLDRAPVAMMQIRPQYPAGFRHTGTSGQATVDFVVGDDGTVYNVYALDTSDKGFEDSAVQAVSQWHFKPGQLGGQGVATHMQVPIIFSIGSTSVELPAVESTSSEAAKPEPFVVETQPASPWF